MPELPQCQVTIHIKDNTIDFATKQEFIDYVDGLRKQARHFDKTLNTWVEDWQQFDHLPVLAVVDDNTGDFTVYNTFEDFPETPIMNNENQNLVNISNA
jgi:hypothetical protein